MLASSRISFTIFISQNTISLLRSAKIESILFASSNAEFFATYGDTHSLFLSTRDSLSSQVDLTITKADSEQLARALEEDRCYELDQELKKIMARHKQEQIEKDSTISLVNLEVLHVLRVYKLSYNLSLVFQASSDMQHCYFLL